MGGPTLAERANLLVLGGGNDQCEAIQELKTLGYRTVCVDQDSEALGAQFADKFAQVSTRDLENLLAFCLSEAESGNRIEGIITLGTDIPHISSRLARSLNLPGIAPKTADLLIDKIRAKEHWASSGVATPRFTQVRCAEDARKFIADSPDQEYVLKPADSSGSRGVFQLSQRNFHQLEETLAETETFSKSKRFLLEEFIPGHQLSTESIVQNGKVTTYGFADRNYEWMELLFPRIIENGGTMPSTLTPHQRREVDKLLERACQAIGLSTGIIKGDLVLSLAGEPMLIELAARQSGGQFSTRLIPLSSGLSAVGLGAKVALGEEIQDADLTPSKTDWVANRYFIARPGQLKSLSGFEELAFMSGITEVRTLVEPGATVPPIRSHADRLGFFIAHSDSRSGLDEIILKAYNSVHIYTA